MGFGKRRKGFGATRPVFTAPAGLVQTPQRLVRSAPFLFKAETPAFSFDKGNPNDPFVKNHPSLIPFYEAGIAAQAARGLLGLRMELIVMVDRSGSMRDEYRRNDKFGMSPVEMMLRRLLAYALPIDVNKKIPVIFYCGKRLGDGRWVDVITDPIDATLGNYQTFNVGSAAGGTPMAGAFEVALQIARESGAATMIVNLTDGYPNDATAMSNLVIASSGEPIMLKNLGFRDTRYLTEIDDLPSQFEIPKDAAGELMVDSATNRYVIQPNPLGNGLRLIDNVDSQEFDPFTVTPKEFADYVWDEVPAWLELSAYVGTITGVPDPADPSGETALMRQV